MRHALLGPAIALVLCAATAGAQDSASAPPAPKAKSAMTARIIGIVPGAGHIYAGETGRGFAYMGGVVGIGVLGTLMVVGECVGTLGESCEPESRLDVVTAAILGLWAWSIYDAGRAAHRTNAKRGLRVSLILAPARSVTHEGAHTRHTRAMQLGLTLR